MKKRRWLALAMAAMLVVNTTGAIPAGATTEDSGGNGVDLKDGLIGYYTFDNTLKNSAGTGSAVLHGGAGDTWNAAATGTAAYAAGKNGQAYEFPGNTIAGTEVSGEGLELDVKMPAEYTLSYWVNPNTVNSATSMVFVPYGEDSGLNIADNWFGATFPTVRIWGTEVTTVTNGSYLDNWVSTADALCGQWTYITLTGDASGNNVLYINGTKAADGSSIAGALAGKDIFLGINFWDKSFDGLMDDVAVYSKALSADEVSALYANKGVPTGSTGEGGGSGDEGNETVIPERVSVHDPSIIKEGDTYYIFGSHLAWAKSSDLINWETFTNNINTDYEALFAAEAAWCAKADANYKLVDGATNMWAPDIIWNENMQKWCMYMSINGPKWNSTICLLTADSLEGDWTYVGPVIQSGMSNGFGVTFDYTRVTGETEVNSRYTLRNGNPTWEPHAIDPCVTYDDDGNLWMSYGSWSGGISLIRLDNSTGLRDYGTTYEYVSGVSDPYTGYRLAGGNQVSGEASYIEKIGDYYYLFVSYGGFVATGGYSMRIFRSAVINGPYLDVSGDDARYPLKTGDPGSTGAGNINGGVGVKLMTYYQWPHMSIGQVAQGHNSAFVDDDGRAYVVYHTRFNDGTEGHSVRVHQLFVNEDGWLVAAPYEYRGETISESGYASDEITGTYDMLFHKTSIAYQNLECVTAQAITLNADGTVSGAKNGTWEAKAGTPNVTMVLDGVEYNGVFVKQTVEETGYETMCFTILGDNEVEVWGSRHLEGQDAIDLTKSSGVVTIPQNALTSFTLETEGLSGTVISYESSNPDVLSDTGKIAPAAQNTDVTLKVTYTNNGVTETEEKVVRVMGTEVVKDVFSIGEYYTDNPVNISDAAEGKYRVPNPFNKAVSAGLDISNGVSVEFDVEGSGDRLSTIMAFSGGGKLYFTGGSYLGYNATGGYFDANLGDGYTLATDYINGKAHIRLAFTGSGFEVYADGVLCYSSETLADGTTKGSVSADFAGYASILTWLNSTAETMDFGWGSWWNDLKFNGTISNVKCYVNPAAQVDTSGYVYYQDFSTLAGTTGNNTGWISQSASAALSVKTDGDTYGAYLNFAAGTDSGNRGAYTLFGEEAQVSGKYTVELDTALTAGVITQRSESAFAILGTDAAGYTANSAVSSGYILKLKNVPPVGTAANQTDKSLQDQWYINDSDTAVTIPVGTWVHIKAGVDTEAGTVTVTITNRETGALLYKGVSEINGTGTLAGLQLLRGRGVGTASVDNVTVKEGMTVGSKNADGTPAALAWNDYSRFFGLKGTEDFTINWKFTNHNPGDSASNWQNYAVAVTENLTSTAWASEDWYLRADYYSNSTFSGSTVTYASDWDWDDFISVLNGAEIDAALSRKGTTMTFSAVIADSDGNTYHYTATAENATLSDVMVYLGGENCYLEISDYSVTSEHHYEDTVAAPTCTEDGYTTHTCIYDETHTYTDTVVPALGHSDNNEDGICDVCGAFMDSVGAKLYGHTLSLSGNIGVNFYMELSEEVLNDQGAYMQFTLPGGNHTALQVMVSDARQVALSGKTYYVFSCGVAAKDMTGEITAQIVRSDGRAGTQYTYTVKEYADYIISHPDDYSSETIDMVKALLNYGGYVQTYFSHNTDNLANQDYELTLPDVTLGEEYNSTVTGSVEGLSYVGTSLMLTTETGIRHYFKADVDISGYTFTRTDTGETLTPVQKGDYYYVEIKGISAKNLSGMYELSVNDGAYTISYSVYTNIKAVLESGSTEESYKNVMKALYQYCEAAKLYFSTQNAG